jgi:hypothetical protein
VPGANVVFAGRDGVDRERSRCRSGRVVRMVKNGQPRVLPWMLLANHFHFRRLFELVDRNYFAVVVERRNGGDVASSHVDEPVRVERTVFVAHVESAIRENDLNVRIKNAVAVGELESALEGERFSRPDVGKPDQCASDAGTGMRNALESKRVSARTDVRRWAHYAVGWENAIEIDGAIDRTTRGNSDDLVGLSGNSDDSRTRRNASVAGVRIVSRMG